jgi:type IV secretion system protein VirB8
VALNPFKRKDNTTEEPAHWYKDQYQHMVVQRNVLAFLTLGALIASVICVFFVMRIAQVKTVEPYVVQIDDKSGIVQLVEPISRNQYAANEMIDRFFVAQYINSRESYNITVLRYNYNVVRVMSTIEVFNNFRRDVSPSVPTSAARLHPESAYSQHPL